MRQLTREEIIKVIEGKGRAERVPLLYDIWIRENAFENNGEETQRWLNQYPRDIDEIWLTVPRANVGHEKDPDYYWAIPGTKLQEGIGIDSQCLLPDWEDEEAVEEFFRTFPDSDSPAVIGAGHPKDERYRIGRWWGLFFEYLWAIRGMENALTDFYLYPDEIHRLFEKVCRFYMRIMERAKEAWNVDGFFVSDDIGTQNAPFFSKDIFCEFLKPYYKKIIDKAHELGCHFWLHSCGNIRLFLPEFVELGLDVIHPIQKHTMDEVEVAKEFGGQITILAGIDVQYLMAFGTPEEVREEITHLMRTYDRSDGRFMMTMGNGSTPDWKRENLEALYEASFAYEESREL